jgi:hypothetical protein
LLEKDCLDDAIKHLHRANDLAKEQKLNFGDDIAVQLRMARKKRWNIQEEKRIHQEIELQTYLNKLIIEDKERKADELRKTGEDVDVLVKELILYLLSNGFFKCTANVVVRRTLFEKFTLKYA